MQYGQPDDFFSLIADDNIILSQLAIGGMAGLLKIDLEDIGFGIIRGPQILLGRAQNRWNDLQELFNHF